MPFSAGPAAVPATRPTALVGLMLQYQRQGKLDVAVQVATQILRSTTATRQSNPNVYYAEDPDASRTAAVGVLARSGRLPQLIDRASEQLKKTPNSIQIHQALADYYKASSQRDKAREELAKIVALRPDDTQLRYQIAQQLVQEGQAALALDHYKIILKRDPSLVGRNFYQVQSAFQQAKKTDELLSLLEDIDLRQLGQSYYVCNLISNMFNDEKLRDRMLSLFKKAWAAFPEERSYMLQYIRGNDFWQMPEMYDYARDVIIPKPTTFMPATQWTAFAQVISYGADGRMTSVVSQLWIWPPRKASSMSLPPKSRRPRRRCRPGKQEPCWRRSSNPGSVVPRKRRLWFANSSPTAKKNLFPPMSSG